MSSVRSAKGKRRFTYFWLSHLRRLFILQLLLHRNRLVPGGSLARERMRTDKKENANAQCDNRVMEGV